MNNYLAVAFAAVAVIIIGIFAIIEKRKLPIATFLPVVVMVAIGSVGRIIFGFIPNVQPVTVIVVIMGLCYSPESGFLTGALSALVSNMVMGQGPWTPWQMLAWGLIGLLAGLCGKLKPFRTIYFAVPFAALSAFVFSVITDVWTVLTMAEGLNLAGALAIFGSGLLFNIPHAIFNAVLMALIFTPMNKRLTRISEKYIEC